MPMSVLSSKRQVTLPKQLCDRLVIAPGDVLDILEHEGRITLLKKQAGRSLGALRHLKADTRYSDEASKASQVDGRRRK